MKTKLLLKIQAYFKIPHPQLENESRITFYSCFFRLNFIYALSSLKIMAFVFRKLLPGMVFMLWSVFPGLGSGGEN